MKVNSMNNARRGFVAIVTIGVCTLILGLVLTLTMKVRGAVADNRGLEKRIQSFLLYQAAITYLNPYWDRRYYLNNDWSQIAGGSRLYLRSLDGVTFKVSDPGSRPALPAQKSAGWFWIRGNSTGDYLIMTTGGTSQGVVTTKAAPFDARLYFKGTQDAGFHFWNFVPDVPDTTWTTGTPYPAFAEPAP